MSDDNFRAICELTLRLTEHKLKEVPHLCIENFAPELLAKLAGAVRSDTYFVSGDPRWPTA